MNILNALILSSLAGLSTLVGAFITFIPIKKQDYDSFMTFCLSLSCIIIIGISLFDLIPDGIKDLIGKNNIIIIIIIFLIGSMSSFIIIKLFNKFLKKLDNNIYRLGIISMIVLMLHNFPEGIITFLSSIYNIRLGIRLSVAIAIHNIPEGIAIAMPIFYATRKRSKGLLYAFIASLAEPLGAILSYFFLAKYIDSEALAIILILVAFLMINLAIEEIYPKINKTYKKECIWGVIMGLIIIFLNIIL